MRSHGPSQEGSKGRADYTQQSWQCEDRKRRSEDAGLEDAAVQPQAQGSRAARKGAPLDPPGVWPC